MAKFSDSRRPLVTQRLSADQNQQPVFARVHLRESACFRCYRLSLPEGRAREGESGALEQMGQGLTYTVYPLS
jgi:hypothetical protein